MDREFETSVHELNTRQKEMQLTYIYTIHIMYTLRNFDFING